MVPVSRFMPEALAEVLRRAPLSDDKVLFAWRTAVGRAVEKATAVTLRDGVLHVVARDPRWRREVERSAPLIRSRLDALLGPDVVSFILVSA